MEGSAAAQAPVLALEALDAVSDSSWVWERELALGWVSQGAIWVLTSKPVWVSARAPGWAF